VKWKYEFATNLIAKIQLFCQ